MRFTTPSGRRDLAMELNARGFRVFPVELLPNSDGTFTKKPVIKGYHGHEPFTPEQIARWQWAKATALGWALPEGHVVLDVDVKHGLKGKEHLRLLEGRYGVLPPTASQRTPSGGLHLVFALPREMERLCGNVPLPEGGHAAIDVCHARLRFVTLYDEGLFDQDVAVLPDAWVNLITKKPRASSAASGGAGLSGTYEDLLAELAEAREGSRRRNRTLYDTVRILALQGQFGWASLAFSRARITALGRGLSTGMWRAPLVPPYLSSRTAHRGGTEPGRGIPVGQWTNVLRHGADVSW